VRWLTDGVVVPQMLQKQRGVLALVVMPAPNSIWALTEPAGSIVCMISPVRSPTSLSHLQWLVRALLRAGPVPSTAETLIGRLRTCRIKSVAEGVRVDLDCRSVTPPMKETWGCPATKRL